MIKRKNDVSSDRGGRRISVVRISGVKGRLMLLVAMREENVMGEWKGGGW